MPSLLTYGRGWFKGLTVDNIFYVFGGYQAAGFSKDVLAWNANTESWEEQSPLLIARSAHAVVAAPFTAIAVWCN
jgi:hypothetical protein